MIIIVDTRERTKSAYQFPQEYKVIRKKLDTGDYSLEGYEDKITIERKTLSDIYGCVGKERKRFKRELLRMKSFDFAAIVIESSMVGFILHPEKYNKQVFKRCQANLKLDYDKLKMKMNPKAAINSLFSWELLYGVRIIWSSNREYGQAVTLRYLEKYYKYFCQEKKN